MSLNEIAEVREITSHRNKFGFKDVNDLLSRGWILLKIYTTCYDPELFPQEQIIHYVLGIDEGTKQANDDWDSGLISNPPQDE